ncbi:MAG TPA: tetratricopeptide repeat protein [bacterium]|jgi:tetratricopeptide (TPR) repeat protein|nr:tetratricopeptide repeat protein [bacterium]
MRALAFLSLILVSPLAAAANSTPGPQALSPSAASSGSASLDALNQRIDAQFQASYFYCLSQLASLSGQHQTAVLALERAEAADPGSLWLRSERAQELEASGDDAAAADLDQAVLQADPQDMDLRRRLSRLYLRLDRAGEARALFLKHDGSDPDDAASLRSLVSMDLLQDDLIGAEGRLKALLGKGGDVDDRELLALTQQRRGLWPEAAAQFRQVLSQDPTRVDDWGRLGACDEAAGDTPTAEADLQAGLKQEPDNAALTEAEAKLHYRAGDFAHAEAGFDRLLELDPKDKGALLFRGLACLKEKRYAQAEQDLTELGKLQQDDPNQGYALALAQILQKEYGPAEAGLKKVLALNPQAEAAWIQLAFLYERQKRLPEAEAALARGIKALPKSQDLTLLLASAKEDAGHLDQAEAVLRDGLTRGGGNPLRFQLAVLLDKQGSFPKAETELQALIAGDPKDAEALNYLGYSWADRGEKLAEAEALIRRALAEDPGNRYYLDSLGWALFKQKRPAEALPPLQEASKTLAASSDADEAVVFDHLAEVQTALGHAPEAQQARTQAEAIRARAKQSPPSDDLDKESGL